MQNWNNDRQSYETAIGNDRAYVSYYDSATGTSFQWTGNEDDWIEVAIGGHGEPVKELIPVPLSLRRAAVQRPVDLLGEFATVVSAYVKAPTRG